MGFRAANYGELVFADERRVIQIAVFRRKVSPALPELHNVHPFSAGLAGIPVVDVNVGIMERPNSWLGNDVDGVAILHQCRPVDINASDNAVCDQQAYKNGFGDRRPAFYLRAISQVFFRFEFFLLFQNIKLAKSEV